MVFHACFFNIVTALESSEKSDLKVYRWVALWFANMEDPEVNIIVEPMLETIPEDKFISLENDHSTTRRLLHQQP